MVKGRRRRRFLRVGVAFLHHRAQGRATVVTSGVVVTLGVVVWFGVVVTSGVVVALSVVETLGAVVTLGAVGVSDLAGTTGPVVVMAMAIVPVLVASSRKEKREGEEA
jgi:hypothetical protein